MNYLLVALGGAVGSVGRYLFGVMAGRTLGTRWPWGTFGVNLLGGLAMGLLIGVLAHRGGAHQDRWRLFLAVGALGGFTTFSSFSLETALMIERGELVKAAGYTAGSVVLGVSAIFIGLVLARRVLA
jgi:CrcB protein